MNKKLFSALEDGTELQQRRDAILQVPFAIINSEGEVLRTGTCQPELLEQQAESGEQVVSEAPPDEDHIYQKGKWRPRARRPSDLHRWEAGKWMLPEQALDILKSRAWEAIKQERDARVLGTFTWEELPFQCDEVSRARLGEQFALAALDPEFSVEWGLADNASVELTAEHLQALQLALHQHTQQHRKQAEAARALLSAARSQKAVEKILHDFLAQE